MAKQLNNTSDLLSNQVSGNSHFEGAEFTKEEAIEKLHEGKKLAHRYFMPHEYIKLDKNLVVNEEGYEHGTIAEYFATLNKAFNDLWTIFKQPENE